MLGIFLHPTALVADLSTLLWLVLVGVAAYAAAREHAPETRWRRQTVGVIYGCSGWFVSYPTTTSSVRTSSSPMIIATAEWTIRSRRRPPTSALGRLARLDRLRRDAGAHVDGGRGRGVLRRSRASSWASVRANGSQVATRLLGGGRDRDRRSRRRSCSPTASTCRSPSIFIRSRARALRTSSVHQLVDWMMPRITRLPLKTPFDDREWIGAGAALLALVAVFHPRAMRRHAGWPLVVVTAIFGLQIYGDRHVSWTGRIPLWSQVGWTSLRGAGSRAHRRAARRHRPADRGG